MISTRGFSLGICCCFCGGKLSIDAASRTTRCDHCASVLKIVRRGSIPTYLIHDNVRRSEIKFLVEQQLKQRGEPLVSRWYSLGRLYVPFWQLSGTVIHIASRSAEQTLRFALADEARQDDSSQVSVRIKPRQFSICADQESGWRIQSLGIRPQVIDLEPLEEELPGECSFAPITLGESEARKLFIRSASSTGRLAASTGTASDISVVGIERMLLYFPVWSAIFENSRGSFRGQFDPLARRLVALDEVRSDNESQCSDWKPKTSKQVHIVPHRCPNCGSDLPASQEAVAFFCLNCRRLYVDEPDGYRHEKLRIASGAQRGNSLFPFWLFSLKTMNGPAKEMFDKAARLIGFETKQFYLPAFHISNPSRLIRLLVQYNGRDDSPEFNSEMQEKNDFVNAVVTPEEAEQLLMPLVTAVKAHKGFKTSEAELPDTVRIGTPLLVWLPYTLDRYFWRDTVTGATIEKAAVAV